jgi:conjugative relaxase-like TrwC/TraI family protein
VLSSAKIGTASWRYYADSVACRAMDYYAGLGEAPGRWHGRGLEPLGLTPGGLVHVQQLEALFGRALHPMTGTQLGRAWRADGVTGFDLTFSAPKSVSALWALGAPYTATQVKAAHTAAVQAALSNLDLHAGLSRRGTDGTEQIGTDGLAAALFEHRTSRAGDPQIHTHALVVNKVRCVDGNWRTVDAVELFHHKKSTGMIYQAALRNELHQRLGVVFAEPNAHGQAEITGVPGRLLELWSKRTTQITAEAAPKIADYERLLGRALTAAEKVTVVKTAVLKTRPGKQHPQLSALHATWTAEAAEAGWSHAGLLRSVQEAAQLAPPAAGAARPADETPEQVLLAAVREAGLRRAVFSRADLTGAVAARLPTNGLTAKQVSARVEELTDRALTLAETVGLGEHPRGVTPRASDTRYATATVLAAEARILSLADRGRSGGYGRVAWEPTHVDGAATGMDPAQYAALERLAGGDFLSVLTAPAGAGKTTTLGAAAQLWTAAGYRVVGLAPSARAAAELAGATGGRADTLAKYLHTHDRLGRDGRLPADLLALTRLDDRTVLIVDEASMASTLDLDRLTGLAARNASKVVLVGDPGQIGVINGPGGMLAALAHAGHGIELTEIHRFTHHWERTASLGLRAGHPAALTAYAEAGRLHPCPDSDTALDGVFDAWTRARADGHQALMLARTRADVDALNTRARAAALTAGQVHGPALVGGGRTWQAGDVLRTRRNDRQLTVGDGHVRNGDRYNVLGPGPAGGLIVEDLPGRGRTVLPAAYVAKHAEYGWACTIDAAQGATTDIGIVLIRPGTDREHLYVGMTRGRQANHAYITPDTADLDTHLPAAGRARPPAVPCDPASDPAKDTAGQIAHVDNEALVGALGVLTAALAQIGAQDAAHTALANGRRTAEDRQRLAESERRVALRGEARRLMADPPVPAHHAHTAERLRRQQEQRDQFHAHRAQLQQQMQTAGRELADCPRWNRSRKRQLTETITADQYALTNSEPLQDRLDNEVSRLTAVVRNHDDERAAAARQLDGAQEADAPQHLPVLVAPRIQPSPAASRFGLRSRRLDGAPDRPLDLDVGR